MLHFVKPTQYSNTKVRAGMAYRRFHFAIVLRSRRIIIDMTIHYAKRQTHGKRMYIIIQPGARGIPTAVSRFSDPVDTNDDCVLRHSLVFFIGCETLYIGRIVSITLLYLVGSTSTPHNEACFVTYLIHLPRIALSENAILFQNPKNYCSKPRIWQISPTQWLHN